MTLNWRLNLINNWGKRVKKIDVRFEFNNKNLRLNLMFSFFEDSLAFHLGCAWFTAIDILIDAGLLVKCTPPKCYLNCESSAFYSKCCRDCLILFSYEKIMPRTNCQSDENSADLRSIFIFAHTVWTNRQT